MIRSLSLTLHHEVTAPLQSCGNQSSPRRSTRLRALYLDSSGSLTDAGCHAICPGVERKLHGDEREQLHRDADTSHLHSQLGGTFLVYD